MNERSLKYRPEIDGLRSIAVLSVLAFHLDRDLLTGGFVGVDVFFVLSGFLITSIINRGMGDRTFSLLAFYQRRIARIAPAFFLVLLATIVTASFVYSDQDFASVGVNSAAAALSILNIKLLRQGGYFELSPDAQPLLHYWSLSVEEQFYMVFPLCVLGAAACRAPASRWMTGCLVGSFVACIATTAYSPAFAFYMLPTRAWELMAGAMLVHALTGPAIAPLWATRAAGLGGVIMLLGSIALIREGNQFPGWIAAAPVAATSLLLLALQQEGGLLSRVLSLRGPVLIGKLSYSLYLWHWPVISFVDYRFFTASGDFRFALKLSLILSLSVLSYVFVEKPLRRRAGQPKRRILVFAALFVSVTSFCVAGALIRSNRYLDAEAATVHSGGFTVNPGAPHRIVLVGDSQASMYGRMLASLASSQGWSLTLLNSAGHNELPGEPGTLWPDVLEQLQREKPTVIVLAEAWTSKLQPDGRPIGDALRAMTDMGSKAIIVLQPPALPPRASRQGIRSGARPPFYEEEEKGKDRERVKSLINSLGVRNIVVLDVAQSFIGEDGSVRFIQEDGSLMFHDKDHLSGAGAVLTEPLFRETILHLLADTQPPDTLGRTGR